MSRGDVAIRWMSVYLIKLWISHLIDGPARASGGVNRRMKKPSRKHEIILNRSQSLKWANHSVVWFDARTSFAVSSRLLRSYHTSAALLTWKLGFFSLRFLVSFRMFRGHQSFPISLTRCEPFLCWHPSEAESKPASANGRKSSFVWRAGEKMWRASSVGGKILPIALSLSKSFPSFHQHKQRRQR